jgi:ubiquitin C-terminal hydrolase
LNRYNPLGTGGELATQFAQLLSEMWTTTTMTTTTDGIHNSNNNGEVLYTTASHIVYPKNFKYSLGKHAAQFMGYDQHDSQELATYLLDAHYDQAVHRKAGTNHGRNGPTGIG